MSSDQIRNAILDAAHKTQPASLPMPHIPHFGIDDTNGLVESFSQRVARMAGTVIPDAVLDLDDFVRNKFPNAKVICSAVPECKGTIRPVELNYWSEASKIDVSIVRSPLGARRPVPFFSPMWNSQSTPSHSCLTILSFYSTRTKLCGTFMKRISIPISKRDHTAS
jgi:hypothetical protein